MLNVLALLYNYTHFVMPHCGSHAVDRVTIDALEYIVPEGHEEANIMLTRMGNMSGDIIIPFRAHAISDATNPAIRELHIWVKEMVLLQCMSLPCPADVDFLEVDMDIVFPAGTNSMVVSVPFTADDIFPEEDKVFEVYLGASPGVFISPIAYVNITIENDDPLFLGE